MSTFDIESMTIKQARRIVRLRDEQRMTWAELAEFYGISKRRARYAYSWANLLCLHDEVMSDIDLLNGINRQLLDAYNELNELMEA